MELRIHVPAIDILIDPQKMEDLYSMMIAGQLYRGLLRYDSNGDVKGDIAESWSQSPDNLTYKFKIKKAAFSDGSVITAKNVQMSFARLFSRGASMAADIDYIAGVPEFTKTKDITKLGIKILSPTEIEFKLGHPSAIFLKQVAVVDCSILPISNFTDEPGDRVFSGPYKLIAKDDSTFTLEKWRSDLFDSARSPQKISFFKSSEAPEKLALEGKTDTLDNNVIPEVAEKTLRSKGWSGTASQLTWEIFAILNPKYVPLEVRRELYQRITSDELLKYLGSSQFISAYGLIPNGFAGALTANDVLDLKKDHSVYGGKKVSFKLDYISTSPLESRLAQWLKTRWDSKNVEVILNPLPPNEKLKRMFTKTSEAVVGQKGTDYPDGFSVLTYFKGKYESNYFHVDDPGIDAAIAAATQELDTSRRGDLYKNIQKMILRHYTNVPLLFGSQASGLWSGNVAAVPSHSLGIHTMSFESIEMRAQ